ncbi:10067_t:CDS:2, partial [Gigaspora margarita]
MDQKNEIQGQSMASISQSAFSITELTESQTTISQFTTETHQININKNQSKSSFNILTTLKNVFTRKPSIKDPSKKSTKILQTQLIRLREKDPEYDEVKDLFAIKTKIHAIIKLQMPTKLENKHEKYKKSIAKKIKGQDKNVDYVTHKMFHGTKRWINCDLLMINESGNNDIIKMENNIPKFCKSGCGLCGIVQQGNRKIEMWFAQQSGISLGYCSRGIKVKVMFVIDCVAITPPSNVFITCKEK